MVVHHIVGGRAWVGVRLLLLLGRSQSVSQSRPVIHTHDFWLVASASLRPSWLDADSLFVLTVARHQYCQVVRQSLNISQSVSVNNGQTETDRATNKHADKKSLLAGMADMVKTRAVRVSWRTPRQTDTMR